MNRGDKVTIYEDPITELKPEGKATLLQRVDEDTEGLYEPDDLQTWLVQFDDEPNHYTRVIRTGKAQP